MIVDFWGTWCGPCREEMPTFATLHSLYGDKGLTIIGISYGDTPDQVRSFAEEYGLEFPLVMSADQVLKDYGEVRGFPTSFIVDKKGVVRHTQLGTPGDRVFFQRHVEELLAETVSEEKLTVTLSEAISHFDAGNWRGALEEFRQLLDSGTLERQARFEARKYMAWGHVLLNEEDQAVAVFREMLADGPSISTGDVALQGEGLPAEMVRLLGQANLEWREESTSVPRNVLLATDTQGGRVLAFSLEDGQLRGPYTSSEGEGPVAMALGPDGAFYLACLGHRSVLKFDAAKYRPFRGMEARGHFTEGGDLLGPQAMAYRDGYLYVACDGSDKVLQYDASSGKFVRDFAVPDDAISVRLRDPWNLAFGPDGHLYVDSATNEIYRFDGKTGKPLGVFATQEDLSRPSGMAFGPDGHLYVISHYTNNVMKFDGSTGEFLEVFTEEGLDHPLGLAFGPDGDLFVGNERKGEIARFDGTTGTYRGVFAADASMKVATSLLVLR